MTATPTQLAGNSHLPLGVVVLGLTVFSLGTTEFMVAGLLPELSAAYGVPISQAGLLISVFALGVVVGAPLITAATTRISRKTALVALLVVFIGGETAAALAPTFGILMAARVVTAVAHGSFFGIGAVVAAGLVGPDRRGRAISIMFGGLTIATVAGVPLGTLLGQQVGWRAPFAAVAVLGVLGLLGVLRWVPDQPRDGGTHLRRELAAFTDPRVWLALATTALSQAGLYAGYTYIAPVLTDVTGLDSGWVPGLLVLFGVGTFLGSVAGGSLADRSLMRTLCTGLLALAAVLGLFGVTSQRPATMLPTLFVFGLAAFVINPALQTRVMSRTETAPTMASTANIAAFNIGNALGPWLGGVGLSAGLGLLAPSRIGALLALAALGVALGSVAADRRVSAVGPADKSRTPDTQPAC